MADKNTIKNWFRTGLRPSQAQFWATWDSFWHKDEKIPITAIDDIETILNEKADREALQNHLTDVNAHAELFAEPTARIAALEAKTDSENNWKTITGYSLNPATRVLTMDAGWEGIINGIEYTNVAAQEMLPAIPLANSGYSRIDLIVFKTDGTFERIAGVESTFTPVAPPKPAYTLEATFLTVGDGVINVPVIPKPKAPVTSVNGMRGDVVLNAINDLVTGGIYDFLSAEQGKVLKAQIDNINTLLASDNVNLDNVQEIVDAIETVQTSLSTILVNDLTTGGTTKALTAEMGKLLQANKVEKVTGKSLLSDTEITRLGTMTITSDAEMQTGTENTKFTTALRIASWFTWIKTQAQTWVAKQTFTLAPRFSSVTASQFLKVDGNKDLSSVSEASDAEMQAGTENTKPITALRIKNWFTWRLTQPFTFGNLAGVGNRVVQVNSSGDTSAPYTIQDGFTTDSDVITALTAATYNSGNNYTATITPANSKVFNQGQFYRNAGVIYFATTDNQASRITLS